MAPSRNRVDAFRKRVKRSQSTSRRYPSRSSNRLVAVPRPVPMSKGATFPLRLENLARYHETISVTTTAGGKANHLFSCNSLYDPNTTGVGHQPLYFDQLCAIYNHHCCIKSYIKVTPMYETVAPNPFVMTLYIDDDASLTNGQQERGGAISKVVNLETTQPGPMSIGWNGAKTFGGDIVNNSLFRGSANSGPEEQSYYVINVEAATAAQLISFDVELYYTVIWSELRSMGTS